MQPQPARGPEKFLYDKAVKAAGKASAFILKKTLAWGGMPVPIAGPVSKYYTKHAEILMRVILTELKYKEEFQRITKCEQSLDEFVRENDIIIKETELTSGELGLGSLITAMLDPQVAHQISEEYAQFKKDLLITIQGLDKRLAECETISNIIEITLRQSQNFLDQDTLRDNVFDLTAHNSTRHRMSMFCLGLGRFFDSCEALIRHRERQAEIARKARLDIPNLNIRFPRTRIEDLCGMPV